MAFYDVVKRIIIVLDLICREVLNNDREKDHSELLVDKLFTHAVLEEELEQFVPLLVGDQQLSQLAYHVCDVFLNKGDWLLHKSLKQELLCLFLVFLCKVHPQVANDLPKVYAGDLSDVLLWARRHQN